MVDPEVVNGVQYFLSRLMDHGLPVSFGVVFGSQISDNATPLSDIDLIVVSPQFDNPITRDSINLLWRTAARTDSRIEPIPCGKDQWQNDSSNAIIEIARRQGTAIYTNT